MNDLEKRLAALQIDLDNTWQKLQINQKIENLKNLEIQISEPEIWQNPEHAKKVNTNLVDSRQKLSPGRSSKFRLPTFMILLPSRR